MKRSFPPKPHWPPYETPRAPFAYSDAMFGLIVFGVTFAIVTALIGILWQ